MANDFYAAIGLIGGTDGKLDKIDGAGLADGDGAVVIIEGLAYFYFLDVDSAAAESSPDIIAPDTNAGNKRWTLCEPYGATPPETTRTINFTSGMSAATIQALIDAVGRNVPNGVTITFQFGDGTYTLDTALTFSGFYGGGVITITGNDGEAKTLHTNQAVILNFTNDTHGIYCENITNAVNIYKIKVDFDSTANVKGFYLINVFKAIISGNYILGDGVSDGVGFQGFAGFFELSGNYVSNMKYGIRSVTSRLSSANNDDTGTAPAYGLAATGGGTIGKSGTQPAGSTANETTAGGGVIR